MTIKEVAEVLRVAPLTVWRYIDSGRLPAYKLGQAWRVKPSELEEFIQLGRKKVDK